MEIIIVLFVLYVIYRIVKGVASTKKPPETQEITYRVEVSGPGRYRSDYDRNERPSGKPAQWYESGQSIKVQHYNISGGMIYVGETLLDSRRYENDACLINPQLKVSSAEPWEAGDEMGYWPQYGRISAKCRGAYLKWLTGGRLEPKTNMGYVFLFFYGLERRLFVDGQKGKVSEKERVAIVAEVKRLLGIYGGNRSFRGYASNFLAMEWVLFQRDKPIPEHLNFNDRHCSEPFQVVLAQYVAEGKPIPAEVALQWLMLHPEFNLRTPARRCPKEFHDMFVRRYKQKFGDGLLVRPNKTPLKLEYRAASPSVRVDLKLQTPDLPNPFILTAPLKKLSALVEECTIELEPYSRFLGRKNNDKKSLAAMALLPKELMSQDPRAEKFKNLLAQVCEAGTELISVDELYNSLGEKIPTKFNKKESETLAVLVEGMGFGIAPDARYHNMKPSPGGHVVIFQHGHGVDFQVSKEFRTVGSILRLGAMVSQIDQDLSPAEEATLQNLIQDNRELSNIEKDSLLGFLYWCIRTPQSVAGIKQRLAEVSQAEKVAISRILISVAHADGRIDPKEVKQLEKLYTTLGLEKDQVTSDIHAQAAPCEPVTVGIRDPEAAFSIPKPTIGAPAEKGFLLNAELIRIRDEETRQVKGVLEGIFADQEDGEADLDSTPDVDIVSSISPLAGLDEAHLSFFNCLQSQETWERSALHEKCKELGLMVDGAMEVLNEWAFDNANAPLIEDGEPVYVDVDLAKEIMNA
ncbi:MAG: TerB N-terminal domain-containing protein [Deltaproteobacteria bacterium]|nr:TerB N-terminal domain-containing protein [Deltaproteobacteria bacterium]